MTRNHFSKHNGPYFINDGLSHHVPTKPQEDIKPDKKVFYFVSMGFGIFLTAIGFALYYLS
jgi:hypothetical protein